MPFDLDCRDASFRAHLSPDQLARLERLEQQQTPAAPPASERRPKPVRVVDDPSQRDRP